MTTTRKQYSPKFKAKVAVEAFRGKRTLSQLASQYHVHPVQIGQWRKTALEQMAELFVDGRRRKRGNAGRVLGGGGPKYILPHGFRKSLEIFNVHRAATAGSDRVIVVEGYFDCLRVNQAGFRCVVGLTGRRRSASKRGHRPNWLARAPGLLRVRHPLFGILLDALSLNAGETEDNPVVRRDRADLANSTRHVVNVRAAETQEIQVFGRPVKLSFPREEEHRALEDEAVLLAGSSEPVQEALDAPSAKQELEVVAAVARQREEFRAVRCRNVSDLLRCHTADSR
ncbi:MAG: transposase [Candidatus Hydrogenedentes bacterium]|nr:transposase [Candidatus Hydrogenedentota bacterium]